MQLGVVPGRVVVPREGIFRWQLPWRIVIIVIRVRAAGIVVKLWDIGALGVSVRVRGVEVPCFQLWGVGRVITVRIGSRVRRWGGGGFSIGTRRRG